MGEPERKLPEQAWVKIHSTTVGQVWGAQRARELVHARTSVVSSSPQSFSATAYMRGITVSMSGNRMVPLPHTISCPSTVHAAMQQSLCPVVLEPAEPQDGVADPPATGEPDLVVVPSD
jgi:hypothetical protein